ncbi:MAG TPA: ABC transporter substrate-binding protein [Devosiaceae bacterium]|jgi:dipeptide transport system substrate-binding protein
MKTALSLITGALLLSAAVSPAYSAALAVCIEGGPDTFNPQLSSSGTTIEITAQIYDELVSVKAGGSELLPSLAESWTASDDGLTYTFKLRHNVKWQSNDAFTPTRDFNADDVVFSFDRQMNEANPWHKVSNGTYITFQTKLADALDSVKKVDDYTVEFHLKSRQAAFLGILAHQSLAITSAEYADKMMAAGTPEALDMQPIGTGPFSFQAYEQDAAVRLLPFHDTWGEAIGDESRTPKVDALILAITPDAAVRLQRLQANECQVATYPNASDRKTIEADPKLSVVETPVASTGFITFNFDQKLFQDQRVREALAGAIDMKNLVDVAYDGTGTVTGAIIPAVLWGHADIGAHPYDVDKAKALLAEAGYPDGFSTQLWALPVSRPYMPNGRRAAEIIQADWAKIGVKADIVSYDWAEYLNRARAGEAPMAMFGGIWDFPDPSQIPNNYFTCNTEGKPSPSNIGHWCNAEFNDLMVKAGALTDQDQRAALYKQAQEVFHKDVPAIVMGSAAGLTAVNKAVQGFVPAVFGTSRFSGVSVQD